MGKDVGDDKTWSEWIDILGNHYSAGDIVAIAIINGKSPQIVIARVERINRVNSKGEPIMASKWFDHPEPIIKPRPCYKSRNSDSYNQRFYPGHICVSACTEFLEKGEYRKVNSCTVRCTPLKDARGFKRWGTKDGEENRAVTYSIPANILLIERAEDYDGN